MICSLNRPHPMPACSPTSSAAATLAGCGALSLTPAAGVSGSIASLVMANTLSLSSCSYRSGGQAAVVRLDLGVGTPVGGSLTL